MMLNRINSQAIGDYAALCAQINALQDKAAEAKTEVVEQIAQQVRTLPRGTKLTTRDFKEAELRGLKAKAAKIPPKVRVFSLAMLMCYLATFFVIIIYEIINSMGSMF